MRARSLAEVNPARPDSEPRSGTFACGRTGSCYLDALEPPLSCRSRAGSRQRPIRAKNRHLPPADIPPTCRGARSAAARRRLLQAVARRSGATINLVDCRGKTLHRLRMSSTHPSSETSKRETLDILLVIPLEEERSEFLKVFPRIRDLSTPTYERLILDTGNPDVTMMSVLQEDMGKGFAAKAVASTLRDYDFRLVICAGIAGGLSKDLRLGDVCYSGGVIDIYDNSKVSDVDGETDTKWAPTYYRTDRTLTHAINFSRLSADLAPLYGRWRAEAKASALLLQAEPHCGRSGEQEDFDEPVSKNGLIACAAVTDSPTYNGRLLKLNRRILAVETESGGVFEQSEVCDLPVLVVRGVSDYADAEKGSLEQKSRGSIRSIAASNCATFLRLQFQNPWFLRYLRGRLGDVSAQSELFAAGEQAVDELASLLQQVEAQVDTKLRELSPQYRLQPRGYRLPIPRVKLVQTDSKLKVSQSVSQPTLEIRTALSDSRRVLLEVPRTYPDKSLAWVIAEDFLSDEQNGLQSLPIVIEGDQIRPPSFGLERVANISMQTALANHLTDPVVIVDDIPIESETRMRYLKSEVTKFPEVRFIFLIRSTLSVTRATQFANDVQADAYALSPISFRQISHFVEKNFDLLPAEAEVIALRLRRTFQQFKLEAYPTYFAAISKDTLSALLQANRRAELIQFAVDGFLSFLVAGDQAEIPLSRTTRARFLRKLAFEMRVEGKQFSESEAVEFAREFAQESDFEIDPIEFIQAFVDRGILHFDVNGVTISLPFIEAYLLAVELREQPEAAGKYFSLASEHFDILTFDIYCELGPAITIVNGITDELHQLLTELHLTEKSALLGSSINPRFLRSQASVFRLQKRVADALTEIEEGLQNAEQKQQLLDLADAAEESASRIVEKASLAQNSTEDPLKERFAHAVKVWAIAATLIGAAAEHLTSKAKRELAAILVQMSVVLIERWTTVSRRIDFEEVRKHLSTEAQSLVSSFSGREFEKKEAELKSTADMMVDALEFQALSEPLRRIMNHLCEEARHKVLALSVVNAQVSGPMEEVVRGAWLMDLGPKKGEPALLDAVKGLGPWAFLRMNLANHFTYRAYWSQGDAADRLSLLGAARTSLLALGLAPDVDELKKTIEREVEQAPDEDQEL